MSSLFRMSAPEFLVFLREKEDPMERSVAITDLLSHLFKEGQEDRRKAFFLELTSLLERLLDLGFTEERFLVLQILQRLLILRLSEGQKIIQKFIPKLVDVLFINISGEQSSREVVREGRCLPISFVEEKAVILRIFGDNMSDNPRKDATNQEIMGQNPDMIRMLINITSQEISTKDAELLEESDFLGLRLLTWLSYCRENDNCLLENGVLSHWVYILQGNFPITMKERIVLGLCNLSSNPNFSRKIGQEPGLLKVSVELLRPDAAGMSSVGREFFARFLFFLALECLENQRLISAEFGGQTLPLLKVYLASAVGEEKEYLLRLFDCLSTEKMELPIKEKLLKACAENNLPEFKKLLLDAIDCFGIVRSSDGATLFHIIASHGESGYEMGLMLATHITKMAGLIPGPGTDLILDRECSGKLNQDLLTPDRAGNLSIHEAIRCKSYRFASFILAMSNSDLLGCRGADGRSVLHAALEPVSPRALYEEHWRSLMGILPKILDTTNKTTLELKDDNGKTPLWLALEYGNHLIAECLIRQKVSIKETFEFLRGLSRAKQKELLKARNLMGLSLVHFLIMLNPKDGKKLWDELIQYLDLKVFLEVVNHVKNSRGKTPRDYLAERGLLSWLPVLPDASVSDSAVFSVSMPEKSPVKTAEVKVKDPREEEAARREEKLAMERAQLEAFWQELKSQKEFWVEHQTNLQAVLSSVIERLESFKGLLSTEVGIRFNWDAHLSFQDDAARAKFLAAFEVFAGRVKKVMELHGGNDAGASVQHKKSAGRGALKIPAKPLSKEEQRKQREALVQQKIAILNQLFSKESIDFVNPIRDSIKAQADKEAEANKPRKTHKIHGLVKAQGDKIYSSASSGTKSSPTSVEDNSGSSSSSVVVGASASGSSSGSSRRSSSSGDEASENSSGTVVSAGAGDSASPDGDVSAAGLSAFSLSLQDESGVKGGSNWLHSSRGESSTLFYAGMAGAGAGAGTASVISAQRHLRANLEIRHGLGFALVSLGVLLAKGFETSHETYAIAWNRGVDIFRHSSRTSDLDALRESLVEFYTNRYNHSLFAARWVDGGQRKARNILAHSVLLPERASISSIQRMNREEIFPAGLTEEVSEYLAEMAIESSLTEGQSLGGEAGYKSVVTNLQDAFYDRISWLSAFNFFARGTEQDAVNQQNALALLISEIAEIGEHLVILSTDEILLKRMPVLDEALRLRNRMWHFAEGCSVESQSGEDLFSPRLLKRISDGLQREYSPILAKDLEPAL